MEDQRRDLLAAEGLSTAVPSRTTGRWASVAGLAVVVALASAAAIRMWVACRADPGLPMWDESAHALAGVEVADALRSWNPLSLFLAIQRQSLWPFVHSLLLAPAFLAGGYGLRSAEAVSVLLWAGTVVLLYRAGTLVHLTRGAWVGLAAAALALLAPSYRVFGSLAMLEIPGAFLLTLAFVLRARAEGRPSDPAALAAAGWASTALFLCKYNYGLTWLAALVAWEWQGLGAEARRRVWGALRPLLAPRVWLRPIPLLLAVGVVAVAFILVTGGGAFSVLGRRVSARSPGNLAYGLWLLFVLWMLIPVRARGSRLTRAWHALPARARVYGWSVVAPLAAWFTLPDHLREFFHFISNRDSGIPFWTAPGLLFYPRALAADFSPAPGVAWAVLALAAWPPRRERAPRAAGLAWLAFTIALLAAVVHRYRDSRFLFTACPMLWLCASRNAVALVQGALQRLRPRLLEEAVWLALAAMTIAAAWPRPVRDAAWIAGRAAYRGPVDLLPALDTVLVELEPPTTAGRLPPPRVVLLGYSNLLSPGLLAWHARLTHPLEPRRLPRRVPTLPADADEAAMLERERWLERNAEVVVAVLGDSVPDSPGYADEVTADRRTRNRLAAGAPGWRRIRERPAGRFVVSRFERAP